MHSRLGFTLIELIITIVITSMLAIVSANFLSQGVSFYVEANAIQRMNADINFVTTKLRKLFRNSIPNSLVVSSDESMITFVPIASAFGYFYVSKDATGGVYQNERVIYVVKSPFFNISEQPKFPSIAFANANGGVTFYKIEALSEVDNEINGDYYKVTLNNLNNSGNFIPISPNYRIYVGLEGNNSYISICHDLEKRQIKIYRHGSISENSDCTKLGTILSDNISEIKFSLDNGSYNSSGELKILYTFIYPKFDNIKRQLSQRIGVNNAP